MTTDAAVLDRTDAPETKTDDLDETKGPEATDVQGEAQTGDESTPTTTDTTSEPDAHLAEIERERAEAEARLLDEKAEEIAAAKERKREADRIKNAHKEKVKQAVPTALSKMSKLTEALGKLDIRDAEGASKPLTERELKAFTNIVEGLGLDVEEAVTAKKDAEYDAAFLESLGADAIGAFWDAAKEHADEDGTIPVSALLDLHAERKALSTKAVKSLTLEQAAEVSATLKKQLAEIKKVEFERGRANPLPAGEPESNGQAVTTGAFTLEEAHDPNIERLAARRAQQKRERGW